ncbi:MAG: hypoxanthine phosphoribosyltransferase [Candidatus Latescibacteria bacterium]|nr:hypoxanthine phosphoribosyltransferase [bacterium]MBD3423008.1 hypoxanthine phosphoribosyltransferase [Candidatus Latescibacterota bacterium]
MHKDGIYYIPEREIQSRVVELAGELSRDHSGEIPVLITLLKGAFIFLADLVRGLSIPHEIDFIAMSSYRNGSVRSENIRINNLIRRDIRGRDIIIVDEIIDTGHTIANLIESLEREEAGSIKVCTLLDKESAREVEITTDYVGFRIPDVFVIGYGLDFKEHFRNLPFIRELTPEIRNLDDACETLSVIEKEMEQELYI